MAKSPLILAALANDAVPHLDIKDAKKLTTGASGAFDSAILTTTDGEHLVVKVPNSAAAGTEQAVELQALKALASSRESLPFAITSLTGETRDDRGAAVYIFDFLYGNSIDVTTVAPEGHLAESIGKAIAAIHNLPTSVVEDAHLPVFDPAALVRARIAELDRAAATGKIPSVLLQRWQDALEDADLFRYLPTVVHGALSGETVLEQDQEVSGVLAWSGLKISDPAEDFAWIFGANAIELNDAVMLAYSIERRLSDQTIRSRATLYSELEMARWMLHGVTKADPEIIEDAAQMLEQLAAEVSEGVVRPLITSAASAVAIQNILEEDAFIPAAVDRILDRDPEIELAKTQAIEIIQVEAESEIGVEAEAEVADESLVADAAENMDDGDEADVFATVDAAEAQSENEESAATDTKTRVIELPEKSENELF
jgi:aminoglycoside phosphotransferase (APT) family kinase protein